MKALQTMPRYAKAAYIFYNADHSVPWTVQLGNRGLSKCLNQRICVNRYTLNILMILNLLRVNII